jgi:hypothetical protein
MRLQALVLLALAACADKTPSTPAKTAADAAPPKPQAPDAAPVPPPDAAPAASPVVWKLEVKPETVKLANQAKMELFIVATNGGKETVDTQRSDSFTIDGAPSQELNMAFGNGGREGRWRKLPAGDSIRESRTGLTLFKAAGDHVIALVGPDGQERARVTVHVTK